MLDQSCLMRWLSARQLPYEGGFQGRTQKVRLPLPVRTAAYLPVSVELARVQLVDSCYSFWQASVPSLVAASLGAGGTADSATEWYNRKRLQQWLLCCCQDARGGLKDKPVYTHARARHTYTHLHARAHPHTHRQTDTHAVLTICFPCRTDRATTTTPATPCRGCLLLSMASVPAARQSHSLSGQQGICWRPSTR
jgi:hypothetical protein